MWSLYSTSHWLYVVSRLFGCCTLYHTERVSSVYNFWLLWHTLCKHCIECPRFLIAAPYITLTKRPTISCCTLHQTDRVAYRFLLQPTSHWQSGLPFLAAPYIKLTEWPTVSCWEWSPFPPLLRRAWRNEPATTRRHWRLWRAECRRT